MNNYHRLRPHLDRPRTYTEALNGHTPAEVLTPNDRRILIRELHHAGHTDRSIAHITRWTDYTVARLRDELHLTPNQPERSAA